MMPEIYPPSLQLLNDKLFQPSVFRIDNFVLNKESKAYHACSFSIHKKQFQFRQAKITPGKTGQFVTVWKRNERGVTEPFHLSENLDVLLVATFKEINKGLFILPVSVLAKKKYYFAKRHKR